MRLATLASIRFAARYGRAGVILGTALLCWFGPSHWSYSYDEDGHFYTAVTMQHGRQPPFAGSSRDQAVLLAFCAQLPDLVKEFDAVTLRVKLIPSFTGSFWGAFSFCWGNDVCRMVTVHHYLHALTDTDAEKVTNAAVATLNSLLRKTTGAAGRADPNAVCAAGFAIHLLADSFAHRRLNSPDRMYAPGLGHYHDDHNPDFILYNKDGKDRTHLWLSFIQKLGETLTISLDKGRLDALSAIVKQSLKEATIENQFHEAEMIATLRGALKTTAEDQTGIWAPYQPAIEKLSANAGWRERYVLQRSCKDLFAQATYSPPGVKELDCDKIWKLYKDAAVEEFKNQKIPAVCPAV